MPYCLPCLSHLIKSGNVEDLLGGFLFPRSNGIYFFNSLFILYYYLQCFVVWGSVG